MNEKYQAVVLDILRDLKEAKANSTQVVGWHHNGATVRGPFNRWLEVTPVNPEYEKHVASGTDDARYASMCMNSVPFLVETIEALLEKVNRLEADVAMDKILRGE